MIDFANKKVAILGMGVEGLAMIDFLLDKAGKIILLDQKDKEFLSANLDESEREKLSKLITRSNIEYCFGHNYLDKLKEYDVIIRSPGISLDNPKLLEAKEAGVTITSQIRIFLSLCPCGVVGVTGTKGKGTTSSLLHRMLSNMIKGKSLNKNVYLAGNIGLAAITLLSTLKEDDIVILELSSFQLMDFDARCQIAILTNLNVDHLDYHKDILEYHSAKYNLFKNQSDTDLSIISFESNFGKERIDLLTSRKKYFGHETDNEAYVSGEEVFLKVENGYEKLINLNELQLLGEHNLLNIASASLAALELGANLEEIREAARDFKGLPHRLELVREIEGIRFVNDSFATGPEPTMAAIKAFSEPIHIILGGSSKGADFGELALFIKHKNIKSVSLIGDEGKVIKEALKNVDYSGIIYENFSNISAVVKNGREVAKEGDVVLLSPACASFGMFKNYKDRGNKFRKAVLTL